MSFPHYPTGVSNAAKNSTLWDLPTMDPTRFHTFFDDFDNFEADQWVVTSVGTGTATVGDERNGVLALVNTAGAVDSLFLQWSGDDAVGVTESFRLTPGKRTFFKARIRLNDVTQSDFVMGLQSTDTSPLAVTHGVYFRKDDGDSDLDIVVTEASVISTQALPGLLANNSFVTLGFAYNGKGAANGGGVEFFVNDVKRFTLPVTNLPDTQDLAVSFGVQNGEAVAKNMAIDYIFVAEER